MRTLHDVRFALRGFRRNLGVTLVTIIVLALGIGANSAIFSVVDALVLRPLPFPAARELVAFPGGVMYPDFVDVRQQSRSFRKLAAYRLDENLLTAPGEPEIVNVVASSADLFAVLGVGPAIGRAFAPDDDQAGRPPVAVVSHGFWQRRLGGDPRVLGTSVTVEGRAVTVIGVMPPAFRFPLDQPPGDLWVSLAGENTGGRQWRGWRAYRSIGRLAPGVDFEQARAEVAGIGARLVKLHPKENAGRTISIASLDSTVKTGRSAFLLLLVAVGIVLLVACANVANLQLGRAISRRREIAIRTALGAGRGRIIRQFLTESLVLALLAGVVGLGAAHWGIDLLIALLPSDVPRAHAIAFDGRVLLYALVASMGTALVVGVAPALQASRPNMVTALRSGDRGTTRGLGRTRTALLVAEIALAVVLLAGAGLLLRSFAHVTSVDPGFDPRSLLLARLKIPSDSDTSLLYSELHRRMQEIPGARAGAIAREMPYGKLFNSWNFTLDDRPPPPVENPWWANARGVSHKYFDTLGIPMLNGRGFLAADDRLPPRVAIINESFARRYWPGGNPIGHRIRAYENDVAIVGVVADTRGTCGFSGCAGSGAGRLDRPPEPEIYLPLAGRSRAWFLAVRSAGISTSSLVGPLRAAVQAIDPKAILTDVRTMEDAIDESLDQRRLVMFLLGAFAVLAVVLAAVGLYGVISYSVLQRTREIGVRIALGAQPSQVRSMVVGQGLRLCLVGLAIGIVVSLIATRLLSSQLFGVSSADPATFAGLAGLILIVAVAACLVPAQRAVRVDPMSAIRTD